MTTFFSRVGLSPSDVGLKVSSRKVLAAVLQRFEVPEENFAQVRCAATCQPDCNQAFPHRVYGDGGGVGIMWCVQPLGVCHKSTTPPNTAYM